jgi:hypothetical protein
MVPKALINRRNFENRPDAEQLRLGATKRFVSCFWVEGLHKPATPTAGSRTISLPASNSSEAMRRLARAEERLESVGTIIPKWMLVSDTIGMIRLASPGRRFPALASRVNGIALERADEAVGRVLRELAQSDELGKLQAFVPGHLATTTRFFLDLVVSALRIRALR